MFEELVRLLKEKGLTIGSVESLTAGLFASNIASVPGASSVLRGGLITYASELKNKLANVDEKVIEEKGVISQEVAYLMARGGQNVLKSNIAISFTGNAGPTVLENRQVGEVFIGLAINDTIIVEHNVFTGDRNAIRQQACDYACQKLLKMLK